METLKLKIDLVKMRVEILKLKANHHDWCCYVPKDVQEQLENVLIEIDSKLEELNKARE